jgi:hypothetical protein
MYDSDLFRFYATDPEGQDFSPYAYAGNAPTIAVDEDGRIWMFVVPIVAYGLFNTIINAPNIKNFGDAAFFFGTGLVRGAAAVIPVLQPFSGLINPAMAAADSWYRGDDPLAAAATVIAVQTGFSLLEGKINALASGTTSIGEAVDEAVLASKKAATLSQKQSLLPEAKTTKLLGAGKPDFKAHKMSGYKHNTYTVKGFKKNLGDNVWAEESVTFNMGDQKKHLYGSHLQDKSILTADLDDVARYVGTGQKVYDTKGNLVLGKERVNFGNKVIGYFYDQSTGNYMPTTNAMIVQGKGKIHIYPLRP